MPEFVTGRGGTNMNPFVKYLNENRQYNSLVILTDGFIPEKSVTTFKPLLTVICSKGEKVEKVKELNWNNVIKIQN
jgi:predicted metal-dependent peptidase